LLRNEVNSTAVSDTSADIKMIKGGILRSPLYRRFLLPIMLTIIAFGAAVYFLAVPFMKNMVYALEEKSVQTNLNNIQKLIDANHLAIEAYKESVTSAHKRQLKNITLFMETYLKNKYEQVQRGLISEDEAQMSALEELRQFRYGNNDYVWVADYNGYYLSHPDPRMNMEDFSDVRDVFGNYVLMPLIRMAIEKGEGYHSYWWQRLGSDLPAEKLTYARVFPEWEWVIGTGVYLDDLEAEIIMRKEKMIQELRQILKPITIGRTGYMYIFDSWKNIIVHPDSQLENTNISSWINPVTGHPLADDLIMASHSKNKNNRVAYKWNRPDDRLNFVYDKIDWVTYIDSFGWYVVASVYADDLNTSSVLLRNRILLISGLAVFISIIIIGFLMSRLLTPIRRLSYTAGLVKAGDLTAVSDVKGKDEIGLLAETFNAMIARLKETIGNLDQKVIERTKELNKTNERLTASIEKLATHNRQVTILNTMAKKIQACQTLEDIHEVAVESMKDLFPSSSGSIYVAEDDELFGKRLRPVRTWGELKCPAPEDPNGGCICDGENKVSLPGIAVRDSRICKSRIGDLKGIGICIPLRTGEERLGMISIFMPELQHEMTEEQRVHLMNDWHRLGESISDQLSMAIINMNLRMKLRDLSIRDGLTGLYNRRYMEEAIYREFLQAERDGKSVGVVILDVDYFKQLNDTHGHKAGDLVLKELAALLTRNIRKGDIVCRYGGEEFLMILPGATISSAAQRAAAIRVGVEQMIIDYNGKSLRITVSIGTAAYPDHGATPDAVIKAADDALYLAKDSGRNRVVMA
jgi:diguanylate cyclase (GGDEF)-like protein